MRGRRRSFIRSCGIIFLRRYGVSGSSDVVLCFDMYYVCILVDTSPEIGNPSLADYRQLGECMKVALAYWASFDAVPVSEYPQNFDHSRRNP